MNTQLQAEEVQSHTTYVDTAHWSSTPCALQVTYTQVALPEEMQSCRLVWPLSPPQSQMPTYTAD